jgi:hypothetical protein
MSLPITIKLKGVLLPILHLKEEGIQEFKVIALGKENDPGIKTKWSVFQKRFSLSQCLTKSTVKVLIQCLQMDKLTKLRPEELLQREVDSLDHRKS